MTLEVQYYSDGGVKEDLKDVNDWTVVADVAHNRPLVAYSKSYNKTDIPKRKSEADVAKGKDRLLKSQEQINIYKATMLATRGVRETRRQARFGPLNNAMPECDRDSKYLDYEKPPYYICHPIPPQFLLVVGNSLEANICKKPGTLGDLLGRFYRGVRTGSGVCSTLSAVATGLMSMHALPTPDRPKQQSMKLDNFLKEDDPSTYVSILNVSSSADHSFALVSYRNSPYYVSDPWPAEPHVHEAAKNAFSLETKRLNSWAEMRVYAPLDEPFGLPCMSVWSEDHISEKNFPPGLDLTQETLQKAWEIYLDNLKCQDHFKDISEHGKNAMVQRAKRRLNIERRKEREKIPKEPEAEYERLNEALNAKYRGLISEVPDAIKSEVWLPWKEENGRWEADIDALEYTKLGVTKQYHVTKPWVHLTNHALSRDKKYLTERGKNPPIAYGYEWGEEMERFGGAGSVARNEKEKKPNKPEETETKTETKPEAPNE